MTPYMHNRGWYCHWNCEERKLLVHCECYKTRKHRIAKRYVCEISFLFLSLPLTHSRPTMDFLSSSYLRCHRLSLSCCLMIILKGMGRNFCIWCTHIYSNCFIRREIFWRWNLRIRLSRFLLQVFFLVIFESKGFEKKENRFNIDSFRNFKNLMNQSGDLFIRFLIR